MTGVEITTPPSTDGATQTRTIGVTITAPNDSGITQYDAELTLAVDATQNGTYRPIEVVDLGVYQAGERTSETFQQFIGVQPPYDLQAAVTFSDDG